ncbi:MAG: hypothetical protein M9962_13205 [Oligoflexia bacterium]|nr:hypothetical protein [Oligoflexia bacterium]
MSKSWNSFVCRQALLVVLSIMFSYNAFSGAVPLNHLSILTECKSVAAAKRVKVYDSYLRQFKDFINKYGSQIQGASQPAPKNQACANYLKAIKSLEEHVKSELAGAQLPMKEDGGGHMLIGKTAFMKALERIGANDCRQSIMSNENKIKESHSKISAHCR